MKLKDKVKSYSFWISLGSAVILILNLIGNKFGFNIDSGFASDLLTSLCSILVLLGIIVTPTSSSSSTTSKAPAEQSTELESSGNNETVLADEEKCEDGTLEAQISDTATENNDDNVFHNSETQTNPVETLKNEIVNQNTMCFNGKEVPTNEDELNAFFEKEKALFIADLNVYIESVKQELLSKK